MVDVDSRATGLTPAHAAGLRRLSVRAATTASASTSAARSGLLSFSPIAESLISHLRSCNVPVLPGLSDAEFTRAEAEFAFTFPPDLRAVLSLGLPAAVGFPDWRSRVGLRAAINLPISAASLQIARGTLWPRSWGPRPANSDRALRVARTASRRAPLLIPLFDRCYIPCRPSQAGNPIFYVDECRIFCCGFDLADFFRRESAFRSPPIEAATEPRRREQLPFGKPTPPTRRSLDSVAGKTPRWIEFWSDAASDRRRRNSSSSEPPSSSPPSPGPACFVEIRPPWRLPGWVGSYLDRIGSVLRSGGWGESEVSEMVHVSASSVSDGSDEAAATVDGQAVLDALLLRADRCSNSLRRAGWSSEDVADVLNFEIQRERERRPALKKLLPEIALKIERLAEAVSRS